MNYKYILSSYFDITKNYNPDDDNELNRIMNVLKVTIDKPVITTQPNIIDDKPVITTQPNLQPNLQTY